MRNDPSFFACDVKCRSADASARLQSLVSQQYGPSAEMSDEVISGHTKKATRYRIGDFFDEILVIPTVDDARAFRIVFHRKANAGRFWKDLMVRILRALEDSGPESVKMIYRGDERLDWSLRVPA